MSDSSSIAPRVDAIIQTLLAETEESVNSVKCLLQEEDVLFLIEQAQTLIQNEPILLELEPSIETVVAGDIHGQLHTMLKLFKEAGAPPSHRYVFIGDMVDRGLQSIETASLILAYKIKYPDFVYYVRGNHECAEISQIYGLRDEFKKKFGGTKAYTSMTKLFNYLPLAAVIGGKILCLHGGIFPEFKMLDQLKSIQRPADVKSDFMTNLLWSRWEQDVDTFKESTRGNGMLFGLNAANEFLNENNLNRIIKANDFSQEGIIRSPGDRVVSIFTAEDYEGSSNFGVYAVITKNLLHVLYTIYPPPKVAPKLELKEVEPLSLNLAEPEEESPSIAK